MGHCLAQGLTPLFAVTTALVVAVIPACGGDDGDTQPAKEQGTEGASCFPNGTCMTGLSCLSDVCVDPGSGTGGAGGVEGGSSAGGFTCGAAKCQSGEACCSVSDGVVGCGTGVSEGDNCYAAKNSSGGFVGFYTECDDNGDCGANEECCALAGNHSQGLVCTTRSTGTPCDMTYGTACKSDSDCLGGVKCRVVFEEQPEWKACW